MYNSYFGFREKPFNVTPDPHFLFANASYQEAYANLLYGIRGRKGFIVLTGEVGTGKTTLLRRVMDNLEDTIRFVFFYNTTLSFEELLDHIFTELRLDHHAADGRLKKIQMLNDFLISQLDQGGTVALLIDEAQNLSEEILENLRLLSNLETAQEKLLQIVLVGQPELEAKLSQTNLRQLKQRIVTWSKLSHLHDSEIGPFLAHRLHIAGYDGPQLFTAEAVQQLALCSKGIPRLINVLCDNALLLAYAASKQEVSAALIQETAHDLQLLSVPGKGALRASLEETSQTPAPASQVAVSVPRPQPLPFTHNEHATNFVSSPTPTLAVQDTQATSKIAFPIHRGQGPRLGIVFLLLLTTGILAFGSLFSSNAGVAPESKAIGFIDVAASLAQTLNRALSSLLTQTMGLEVQDELLASSIAKSQENLQEQEEISLSALSPSRSEGAQSASREPLQKTLEVGDFVEKNEPLKEALDAESSAQSVDSTPTVKNPFEAPSQQSFPSRTTAQLQLQEKDGQTVRLQPGDTILNLVRQIYGDRNTLALALLKDFNPHFEDLDYVAAGATVLVPAPTEETLLRKQLDGSYRLLLAVFPKVALAQKHADAVRRYGYSVEVVPTQLSKSLLLYRVEVAGLPTRESAKQAWTFVDTHNVLTITAQTSENTEQTE